MKIITTREVSPHEEIMAEGILARLRTRMLERGLTWVEAEYNGGGGDANLLSFITTDLHGCTFRKIYPNTKELLIKALSNTDSTSFLKDLWALIGILHFGFDRDDGGAGTLTLSLPKETSALALNLAASDWSNESEAEDMPFQIAMSA